MGIDTIMRADRIILMAWGEEKAHIVQRVVEARSQGRFLPRTCKRTRISRW